MRARAAREPVAMDRALRADVDDRRRHRAPVRHAAAERRHVPRVRGGVDEALYGCEQVHLTPSPRISAAAAVVLALPSSPAGDLSAFLGGPESRRRPLLTVI